jgi:hypothetical protein
MASENPGDDHLVNLFGDTVFAQGAQGERDLI